jgi:hypothetical protein
MRTIVEIPDDQVPVVADQCKRESISRAELVRRAIALYLRHRGQQNADVFGLWTDRKIDGVEYQRTLRAEWDE